MLMKAHVEKPPKTNKLRPIIITVMLIGVVVAGGAAALFFTSIFPGKPSSPLAFEIVSVAGDAQIMDPGSRGWRTPERGEEFREGQRLRTGADGVINFQVEDQIILRLKENAELQNKECRTREQRDIYKLHLNRGVLLGATTKEFDRRAASGKPVLFVITTPYSTVTPNGAVFRIVAGGKPNEDKVGVLRGSVEIEPSSFLFRKQGVRIRGLEKANLVDGAVQAPTRVTPEEWQEMKEAYELLAKSAAMEAEQINLSKLAGSFFSDAVFDHGTFYTPQLGYAGREFFKDPDSGAVLLETEYDVFPDSSFVGIYAKTRNFDLSRYDGLAFDVRRRAEEGAPDNFFIEFKSKGNVIRRFAVRGFHRDWTPMEFKFYAKKETPINEMVFVFTNKRVGEDKKGVLEFGNFNLIPRKEPLPEESAAAQVALPVKAVPQIEPLADESLIVPVPSAPSTRPEPQVTPSEELPSREAAPEQSSEEEMVPQTISLR